MNLSSIETRLRSLEIALASTVSKDLQSLLAAAHNIEQYILGGSSNVTASPLPTVTPTTPVTVTVTTSA